MASISQQPQWSFKEASFSWGMELLCTDGAAPLPFTLVFSDLIPYAYECSGSQSQSEADWWSYSQNCHLNATSSTSSTFADSYQHGRLLYNSDCHCEHFNAPPQSTSLVESFTIVTLVTLAWFTWLLTTIDRLLRLWMSAFLIARGFSLRPNASQAGNAFSS